MPPAADTVGSEPGAWAALVVAWHAAQHPGELELGCHRWVPRTYRDWATATRRPFLSFPLKRHFEPTHVRHRLHDYCADCAMRFKELTVDELV